ncbi:MAG: DUF5689 domain-containing protein [Bacteroidaceae bacterium]|nr:DUF5689 domain-containing protein [Bacteroidaceae bacterium]MDO4995057.1 DUF5689 domain-containing protein [Bacteroidales bacterium]
MKTNIILLIAVVAGLAFTQTSCNKFDYSEPDTSHDVYTQDQVATGCNTTLAHIKGSYKTLLSAQNGFLQVEDDMIFDGYVCANDITGNLYQSIYVRKIEPDDDGNMVDNCIVIGINDNSLWTTYPVGTHVKVNLKNLYLGTYSYVPKVGMPYITSAGNTRLGGMAKFLAPKNIEVIGFNDKAPETVPIDIDDTWLSQNKTDPTFMYKWTPTLVRIRNVQLTGNYVTIEGKGQRRPVYAVYDDKDAGNGVNDSIWINNKPFCLRQSVLSSFSSDTIPQKNVDVIAVLSRYSDWQFSLRSNKDRSAAGADDGDVQYSDGTIDHK